MYLKDLKNMYLKDLKNMYYEMPEGTDEEIRDKLLIGLYVLQPPLNISLAGIVLNLKKPILDMRNYFVLRNKSWIFHINKNIAEKQIIRYNKIHNKEIYRLLKLSYDNHPRLYLFNLNNNELNINFKKITKERLKYEISINDIPLLIADDLINSSLYNTLSSHQKENYHKKYLGFSIISEYGKLNLVEFQ
jgi:hypothetical protein